MDDIVDIRRRRGCEGGEEIFAAFCRGGMALRLEGRFKGATKFPGRGISGFEVHRKYFQGQLLFRYTFTPQKSALVTVQLRFRW
jgi:hypothetical protein